MIVKPHVTNVRGSDAAREPAAGAHGRLRRTCACGSHGGAGGECDRCRAGRGVTLRRAAAGAPLPGSAPPIVHEVLRTPGRPLDAAARDDLEPRLGHDFSKVRVHTDARAAESARAVHALAYTVGRDVVFGTGRYAPGSTEGRRLLAHELVHTVQQGGETSPPAEIPIGDLGDVTERDAERVAGGVAKCASSTPSGPARAAPSGLATVRARGGGVALRRQPDPSPTASPTATGSADTIDLAPGEDVTEKNPKIIALAKAAREAPAGSPRPRIVLTSVWSSAPALGDDWSEKQAQLRGAALGRGEAVRAALVGLGVPAASVSVFASDSNQDSYTHFKGQEGHVRGGTLDLSVKIPELGPIYPPAGSPPVPAPATSSTGALLDLGEGADLTEKNLRIAEALRGAAPLLKDAANTLSIIAYAAVPAAPAGPPADPYASVKAREAAETKAFTLRAAVVVLGASSAAVDASAKLVSPGDPRAGHVTLTLVPKAPAAPAAGGVDFDKFTTFELKTDRFSLVLKIPKSLEVKFRVFEAKLSIPKGVSVTLKPVRGIPGLEIGLSGEITKLSDLVGSPAAPTPAPDGFKQPAPGPPVKFSLSIALNGKGYKVEATGGVDLNKRTVSAGLAFSLIESGVKYQVPSSVFDDLNKAGAQLQKAVNNLMGVPDQPSATAPVGQPPPPAAAAPTPGLSDLSDAVDALSTIIDAMDKIDKAKQNAARPTLKIGPTLTVPFGPPREGTVTDPLGNKPVFGFGITGTFN